jgi:hypothetical protein
MYGIANTRTRRFGNFVAPSCQEDLAYLIKEWELLRHEAGRVFMTTMGHGHQAVARITLDARDRFHVFHEDGRKEVIPKTDLLGSGLGRAMACGRLFTHDVDAPRKTH